jgi:hypothetical protein
MLRVNDECVQNLWLGRGRLQAEHQAPSLIAIHSFCRERKLGFLSVLKKHFQQRERLSRWQGRDARAFEPRATLFTNRVGHPD